MFGLLLYNQIYLMDILNVCIYYRNMYSKIVNPETNRLVNINGQMGQQILRNYLNVLRGGARREGLRSRHIFSNSAMERDRIRESTSGAHERSVQADFDAREDDAYDAEDDVIREHLGRRCWPFCNPVDLSKMDPTLRDHYLNEAAKAAYWERKRLEEADWEAGEAAAGHAYSYDDVEEEDASAPCFADCADATSAKCTTCVEDFQDKVAPGFRAMCNIMGA